MSKESQSFSVESRRTTSNQSSRFWNLSEKTFVEKAERLPIPPVRSLRGIHAYDEIRLVAQLKNCSLELVRRLSPKI